MNPDERFESPWVHFQGLGLDPSIPPYLRVTGKVQNLSFSKGDTEMYINEIWIAKEEFEKRLEEKKTSNVPESGEHDEFDPENTNAGKIHLKAFYPIYLEVCK